MIDSIVADATGIEFDWVVGAAPMAFKGELKFSVCAKRTNSLAEILNEWHSRIGTGIVNAGLEATVEDIGGYDLAAQLQQEASQAKANAEAAKDAQEAAEKSAGNAANSESAAKTSAEQAAAARDTAQELAGRVIVDDALSDTSASPVQNKVIFAALAKKQDVQRVTFVINDTDGGLDAVVAD